MVYLSQLLHAAVEQSYETNKMVAEQVLLALQRALNTGLKGEFDPKHPEQLRQMATDAVRKDVALKDVLESVNRYSLTVDST